MKLNLTWDLFIIVFFIITLAYSCIIGTGKTFKIMLGSYITTLTSDGIGNLVVQISKAVFGKIGLVPLTMYSTEIIILKIALFVFGIVLISTKGNFEIGFPGGLGGIKKYAFAGIFTVLSVAFLIATIMIFLSGGSFLSDTGINIAKSNISNIYNTSYLAQLISLNYNLIFVAPAVTFIAMNIIYEGGGEESEED